MVLTLGARVAGAAPTFAAASQGRARRAANSRSRRRPRPALRSRRRLPSRSATPPRRLKVSERPWAVGVSTERQEAALAHLQEGNSLLKESLFLEAAKVYRKALSEWDHPGIPLQPGAGAPQSRPARRGLPEPRGRREVWRADPLDPRSSSTPRATCRLIEKQVASLEVSCDVSGARVTFRRRAAVRGARPLRRALCAPGPTPSRRPRMASRRRRARSRWTTTRRPRSTSSSTRERSDRITTAAIRSGAQWRSPRWRGVCWRRARCSRCRPTGTSRPTTTRRSTCARANRSWHAGLCNERPQLHGPRQPAQARRDLPAPGHDRLRFRAGVIAAPACCCWCWIARPRTGSIRRVSAAKKSDRRRA